MRCSGSLKPVKPDYFGMGPCPDCNHYYRVRKDGKIRQHQCDDMLGVDEVNDGLGPHLGY